MNGIKLNLVVLKTHRLDVLRDFYSALGFLFIEERHGEGPPHFAAHVGDVIFELYTLPESCAVDSTTRLGFAVPDLDAVVAKLGAAVVSGQHETAWGRSAVVRDPDGRKVELVQG
jgi:catechol 2,3-dioxygenase-like lactoylglutathione lyase family enzyme